VGNSLFQQRGLSTGFCFSLSYVEVSRITLEFNSGQAEFSNLNLNLGSLDIAPFGIESRIQQFFAFFLFPLPCRAMQSV
jgi:hypothetical protein